MKRLGIFTLALSILLSGSVLAETLAGDVAATSEPINLELIEVSATTGCEEVGAGSFDGISEVTLDGMEYAQGCCKICSKGKACGNSCISRSKRCHKGRGCACDS